MNERFQFVRDARRRLVSFTELCAIYGISRPVGYMRLHRAEQSEDGLFGGALPPSLLLSARDAPAVAAR